MYSTLRDKNSTLRDKKARYDLYKKSEVLLDFSVFLHSSIYQLYPPKDEECITISTPEDCDKLLKEIMAS
ncbi:hypothetical protein HUT03_04415 [Candidatus Liberibacter africanus]|uniref:Uncharacterized protein n=1 Tax=Candidatus Liberibacter africanus PTSAPSY TaxID=1277257 RepID=A0A0G3I3P7_LIBAF|nr:hypothetical protein [Candidatus Liberibacter africanus]AKK20486.1 hypothetical protein G293_04335 [Candidatus Liberibacter africanus PTSAPSY]QTP64202.1 hypothetical protein HUT03_04415 [Candidatus Liberibacter africanus]